jgi:hypothetical protein
METTSVRQRLRRVPAPVVDAGLAVALAVAIMVAIRVAPLQGAPRDALADALGLTIAALALVRRRWPLAVLLASAVILQVHYQLSYPAIFPAVPLSVALATAWAAGHQRWALLVALFYVGGPLLHRPLVWSDPLLEVVGDELPDAALVVAVLLLGEAVRTRRALALEQERSERLLLNVLPRSIAARLKGSHGVIADGFAEATVLFADIVDFTRRSERTSPQLYLRRSNDLSRALHRSALQRRVDRSLTSKNESVAPLPPTGGVPLTRAHPRKGGRGKPRSPDR